MAVSRMAATMTAATLLGLFQIPSRADLLDHFPARRAVAEPMV